MINFSRQKFWNDQNFGTQRVSISQNNSLEIPGLEVCLIVGNLMLDILDHAY